MLVEKFEDQVKRVPGNIAVKTDRDKFTYAELNRYANGISRRILGHASGGTVGLLFEHGVHMIAAILGALKAGKTYVPLSVDYPAARLSYMLTNSESSLVLTNTANEDLVVQLSAETGIPVHSIDPAEVIHGPEDNTSRTVSMDDTAYILYTSGSTGRPKGVYQTLRNADYYNRNWVRVFGITSSDRMTLFSSFCHDGSVQDMFSALYSGATLYPMNMKNRENTIELSEFLVKEEITIWHSVPSLFSYFANTLTGSETFPHLHFILLGGEPVRKHEADLLKRFFPHCTMANVYGQTESSVNSICLIHADADYDKPMIGMPLDETEIFVIDSEGDPVGPLETGEILIGCKYISPGYWKNPEATEKVFAPDEELGRLYWTGDLGRLLLDGRIEFLGRRDTQIKIRGFRVELGEIETQLLKLEQVKEAIVTAREDESGDKYLSAYIVVTGEENKLKVQQLREFIADELPDYMVPTYFMFLEKMPLTPNGKIDRKALPEPGPMEAGDDYVAPRNEVEEELTVIWSDVLGVQKEMIGIDADFFQMGGHSLKATMMVSKIHKAFNVKVPLMEVFKKSTVRQMAEYIKRSERSDFIAIKVAEKKEYYVMSSAQKRLLVLQQNEPDSITYNINMVLELKGSIDTDKMESCFRRLIQRHESLRTSFEIIGNNPVQKIHQEVEFLIPHYSAENEDDIDGFIKTFVRPFNLSQPPLMRVGFIKVNNDRHILMVDIHHIVSDGFSHGILKKEFTALYEDEELPPLRLQYKDFAEWQNKLEIAGEIDKQKEFWLEEFNGEIPILKLPLDFPRSGSKNNDPGGVKLTLTKELSDRLRQLAALEEVTLFTLGLALYNIFLSKLSGQDDIIVGTVVAGRRHEDIEPVMGMFVNTLALRNYPSGDLSFREFLRDVNIRTLEAFENQDYQFDALVDNILDRRDVSRNPLFDVVFTSTALDPTPSGKGRKLNVSPYYDESAKAKFDLVLGLLDTGDQFSFPMTYRKALFKKESIQRFLNYFEDILYAVLKNKDVRLNDISVSNELQSADSNAYDTIEEYLDF